MTLALTRRALLGLLTALPLVGCGSAASTSTSTSTTPPAPARMTTTSPTSSAFPSLAALEARYGARLVLLARDTGS